MGDSMWQAVARRPYVGHDHFWQRAMSRRQFLGTTAAATAAVATSSVWFPAIAEASGGAPVPIPGGFFPGYHAFLGPGVEPSTIFNYRGTTGVAAVQGTGTGWIRRPGNRRPYSSTAITGSCRAGTSAPTDRSTKEPSASSDSTSTRVRLTLWRPTLTRSTTSARESRPVASSGRFGSRSAGSASTRTTSMTAPATESTSSTYWITASWRIRCRRFCRPGPRKHRRIRPWHRSTCVGGAMKARRWQPMRAPTCSPSKGS